MKRYAILYILMILCALAYTPAWANPYVSFQGGVAGQEDSTNPFLVNDQILQLNQNNGFMIGGSGGYDFGMVRGELEIQHLDRDIRAIVPIPKKYYKETQKYRTTETGESVTYFWLNGYGDLTILERTAEAAGAELFGGGGIDLGGEGYHATLGVNVLFDQNWGLNVAGRHVWDDVLDHSQILFGIRYTFK